MTFESISAMSRILRDWVSDLRLGEFLVTSVSDFAMFGWVDISAPANVSRFPVDLALLREDNALTLKIPPLDATGHSSDPLPFSLG